MTCNTLESPDVVRGVLRWAVDRRTPLKITLISDSASRLARSQFLRYDQDHGVLLVTYPVVVDGGPPVECAPGDRVGVSFRRGHKKCVFVSTVVMRQTDADVDGQPVDALAVRGPTQLRELQRRAYQRATLPPDRFVAVKIWEGGVPDGGGPAWPICSGRVGNVSMGGIQVEVRADQNPRLGIGDTVGIEITAAPGRPPIAVQGQYRHCTRVGDQRLALGFQFVGVEHGLGGAESMSELAAFVGAMQKTASRLERSDGD